MYPSIGIMYRHSKSYCDRPPLRLRNTERCPLGMLLHDVALYCANIFVRFVSKQRPAPNALALQQVIATQTPAQPAPEGNNREISSRTKANMATTITGGGR